MVLPTEITMAICSKYYHLFSLTINFGKINYWEKEKLLGQFVLVHLRFPWKYLRHNHLQLKCPQEMSAFAWLGSGEPPGFLDKGFFFRYRTTWYDTLYHSISVL